MHSVILNLKSLLFSLLMKRRVEKVNNSGLFEVASKSWQFVFVACSIPVSTHFCSERKTFCCCLIGRVFSLDVGLLKNDGL